MRRFYAPKCVVSLIAGSLALFPGAAVLAEISREKHTPSGLVTFVHQLERSANLTVDRLVPLGEKRSSKSALLHEVKMFRKSNCRHVKTDGVPCRANAQHDSIYCFFHDPASAKEREAARVNGGKERSRRAAVLPPETPDAKLTSAADVTGLLAETINQVRRGELDPRVANTVGYLAGMMVKAKQDDLEQRLVRLESILGSKWVNRNAAADPLEHESFEFVNPKTGGEA